ncbi:peptidase C48, SUMO/sentrin/Ubl1 [Tanacetum coccineum]
MTVGGERRGVGGRNEEGALGSPGFPPSLPALTSFPPLNLRPFMGLSLPRSGRLGCRVPRMTPIVGKMSSRSSRTLYVGNLPGDIREREVDDLFYKDHMRKAGDVCFSQVFREGTETTGIADYTNYDDMKYAIRKLDDTEFRNAFSRAYIRVKEYDSRHSRSLSRSRSRSRSKSPKAKSSRRSRSLSKSASPRSGTKRGSLSSIVNSHGPWVLDWEHEESWIWIAMVKLDCELGARWLWTMGNTALGSEFLTRNVWILNSVVSETFADPLQDPDLLYRLARRLLVKAPKNAVQAKAGVRAEAGVVAGARVYQVADKVSDALNNKPAGKGKKPVVGKDKDKPTNIAPDVVKEKFNPNPKQKVISSEIPVLRLSKQKENPKFKAKVNVKRKMILSKEDDRKKNLKGKPKKDVSDSELETNVVDYSSDEADRKRKKSKIKAGLKRKRSGLDSSDSSELDTKNIKRLISKLEKKVNKKESDEESV